MRSIDPDPEPWRPLGHPIAKPSEAAPAPAPTPLPGAPHIERGPDGKLSTNLPLPKGPP